MPIIPRLQRRVGGQPLPTAQERGRAPVSDSLTAGTLEDIGRRIENIGLQQIGQEGREEQAGLRRDAQVAKEAAEMQDRIDKTTVLSTSNGLRDFMRSRERQWGNLKIDKAVGLYDTESRALEEFTAVQRGSFSNDKQRALYDVDNSPEVNSYLDKVAGYQLQQFNNWEKVEGVAKSSNAIQAGIESTTPDELQDAITDHEIGVQAQGLVGEQADVANASGTSDMLVGRIDLMLARDQVEAAQAFYDHESVKDNILPGQRDEVEERIKVEETGKEAFRLSEQIITEGGTDSEMRRSAKAVDDKYRKESVRLVEVEIAQRNDQKIKQDRQESDRTTLDLVNANSIADASDIINSIDDNEYIIDRGKLKRDLVGYFNNKLKEQQGKPVVTTPQGLLDKFEVMDLIDNTTITREQITAALGGSNSTSSLEEVLEYQRSGGILGKVKESTLRTLYKNALDMDKIEGEDDIAQYMIMRNFIIDHIKSSGSYNENDVVNIIQKGNIRTPATGFVFKTPGGSLAQAREEGTIPEFIKKLEVPEKKATKIINRMIEENDRREAAGESLLRIDEVSVKAYHLKNNLGFTVVKPPPQAVVPISPQAAPAPITPAPVAAPADVPAAQEVIDFDAPISPDLELDQLTKEFLIKDGVDFDAPAEPELTEKEKLREEVSKYPKELRQQIASIITNKRLTDEERNRIINNLLRLAGFPVTTGGQ